MHPILNGLFLGLLGLVPCASYIFLKTFCHIIFRVAPSHPCPRPPTACKGCALCLQGMPQILDSITSYKPSTRLEVQRKVESLSEHGKGNEGNHGEQPWRVPSPRCYCSLFLLTYRIGLSYFQTSECRCYQGAPPQDCNACGLGKGTEMNQSGDGFGGRCLLYQV